MTCFTHAPIGSAACTRSRTNLTEAQARADAGSIASADVDTAVLDELRQWCEVRADDRTGQTR